MRIKLDTLNIFEKCVCYINPPELMSKSIKVVKFHLICLTCYLQSEFFFVYVKFYSNCSEIKEDIKSDFKISCNIYLVI